jgi:hypothetical protein
MPSSFRFYLLLRYLRGLKEILHRLFTRPGIERTIPIYPTNSLHTSVFLIRLKTLYHDRVFLEKIIQEDFKVLNEYQNSHIFPHLLGIKIPKK